MTTCVRTVQTPPRLGTLGVVPTARQGTFANTGAGERYGCRGGRRMTAGRSPEKLAGRGQKDTVRVLQTRAGDLTAKNRKLVPEYNDLEVLNSRERRRNAATARTRRNTDTPATRVRADSLLQDGDGPLYDR
jgi:hypothetical protein